MGNTKKNYKIRWYGASLTTLANVDVMASSDSEAKRSADRLGKELGVSNCQRSIWQGTREVE